MKILCLADVEVKAYWDFYRKEDFPEVDLIISCGDLKSDYLSFLATMTTLPVLYVRGNHDSEYKKNPPGGCICIEDQIYHYEGLRILGLGGSHRYKLGDNQFTQKEMDRRVWKLAPKLFFSKGVDILVSHAPAAGVNDGEDLCHQGFEAFNRLIVRYQPQYFLHGHVHMNYGRQFPREDMLGNTRIINAYEKYIIEI